MLFGEKMTAQNAPLFEIELGPDKVRFAPISADEISQFLVKEYATWEKVHVVANPPQQDVTALGGVNVALKVLGRARTVPDAIKTQTGAEQTKSIENARNQITQIFNEFRLPLSESIKGKLIADLAARDLFSAKVALYIAGVGAPTNAHLPIVSPSTALGIVEGAHIQRLGGTDIAEGAVRKLVEKCEKELAQCSAGHQQAVERVNTTHRSIEAELQSFRGNVAESKESAQKLIGEMRESFGEELQKSKDELEKFREVIKKDIALKAPSEYWRGKAKAHRRNAVFFFVVLTSLMLCFGWSVANIFPTLIPQAGKELPSYGYVVAIVILATLAFWVLRIVARLFFSQTHLTQDAQERVTMVTTYLALVETGKFQAGDLAAVLNALFRNASDGIVKDEGMPLSLFEFMTRQGK